MGEGLCVWASDSLCSTLYLQALGAKNLQSAVLPKWKQLSLDGGLVLDVFYVRFLNVTSGGSETIIT